MQSCRTSRAPATTDRSFLPVQGLRGIAALSVLMDHFYDMPKGGMYDIPDPGFLPPLWLWLQSVINVGGHGVELFFMISGFLIPASLVRHGSPPRFFFDRILRIMPVFVVLHLALFTVGPIVAYKFFRGIDLTQLSRNLRGQSVLRAGRAWLAHRSAECMDIDL